MKKLVLTIQILCFSIFILSAQKFEGIALTPPMGWNTWNHYRCEINEQIVLEMADAMVESGMADAGYEYIVIDDCWQIDRDEDGNIVVDSIKFPSGIKYISDYIHSKGLKFGLYSDAGTMTCQKRPGGRGYEFQDARQYAEWEVDFLKYDWCHTGSQDPVSSYTIMRDALYKAGRPVVFSICDWGFSDPWTWAGDVGHLWRTSGDIRNNWDIPDAGTGIIYGGGVVINLDMQLGLHEFAGPDRWNDPDMLEVGNGGLTVDEEISHFSLWCMLAAPLIAGNDLREMPEQTREILTNKEVIAIDQDPLGKQGYKIVDERPFEIFYKPLSNDEIAICLFNRTLEPVEKTIEWSNYDIKPGYIVRDLWEHKDIGNTNKTMTFNINPHGVIMLRLKNKQD